MCEIIKEERKFKLGLNDGRTHESRCGVCGTNLYHLCTGRVAATTAITTVSGIWVGSFLTVYIGHRAFLSGQILNVRFLAIIPIVATGGTKVSWKKVYKQRTLILFGAYEPGS